MSGDNTQMVFEAKSNNIVCVVVKADDDEATGAYAVIITPVSRPEPANGDWLIRLWPTPFPPTSAPWKP